MDPKYGRRLMPTILHEEARRNPSRKYGIITKTNSVADGFEYITFAQVSRAVNYVANWLQTHFEEGHAPEPQTTLAYVGVVDVRYSIVFYAAIQCRYKVFLPSPRNPTLVNASLLEQTQCTRLVYSGEVGAVARGLVQARPSLCTEELPSLHDLLEAQDIAYKYDLKFEDVCQEAVLVLHSSGSTGMPKPVICTHGTCATFDIRDYPTVPGRMTVNPFPLMDFPGEHVYNMFPPFHLAGCMYSMMFPLFGESITVFGPALRPPSGALAAEMIKIHKPRAAYVPPVIIEQLSHEPNFTELVSQLSLLIFAGGPLPPAVGDRIATLTRLGQFYGSTEVGMIHQLLPAPEDWSWMEFHPREPIELQPVNDGESYEMVLFADRALKNMSPFQHNYPDLQEWRTKDLFVQHPTKPNLWKFHARRDDILVLSNGHKVNPLPVETALKGVAGINGALVVGQGRASVALLIELTPDALLLSHVRQEEDVWLAVENANNLLPAYGQVVRSMVIIADPNKSFERAAKGTIIRRLTEKLYADEIEKLYIGYATETAQVVPHLSADCKIEDVKSLIRSALRHVSIDDQQLQEEDNFFIFGMDSIKTVEVLKLLRSRLGELRTESELKWLSLEAIYRHWSISSLASMLFTFLTNGQTPNQRDRVIEMQAKIAEYVRMLPQEFEKWSRPSPCQKSFAVAVTGTTGFLGGYLVDRLAQNKLISHVYCLNRSAQAEKVFRKRQSWSDNSTKLTFLTADFTSPRLGLSDTEYENLLQECEVIVHNAWRLNFNFHLSGFEDNLLSVKNLIDLSARSPRRPRLVFVSSVSSSGWKDSLTTEADVHSSSPQQTTRIPEGIVDDTSTTMDMGYAESKRVAEHVLHAASSLSAMSSSDQNGTVQDMSNIPSTIIRLCQVAPEKNTKWPDNDAQAALLRSCKTMKMIPTNYTDVIDWIPVDRVASIIDEIVGDELMRRHRHNQEEVDRDDDSCRFYNVVNPRTRPWAAYVEILRKWCGSADHGNGVHAVELVSYSDWMRILHQIDQASSGSDERASGSNDSNDELVAEIVPATRVMRLFELGLSLGSTHAYEFDNLMKISPTMREHVAAIDLDMFKSWLEVL